MDLGSKTPKPPEMPLKQGKTSQYHNWPRNMDWPQIGPKIATKQVKKRPKGLMVPISRAHGGGSPGEGGGGEGAGRVSAGNLGGLNFFFSGPKLPARISTLVAPYCAIPRDYLSDTPLLRAMGFLVSQHGQLGAIPPPPFLSISPLESMRSGGAIPPPPSKGLSQRYLRDTPRKQGKRLRYPPLRYYLERVLRDMGGRPSLLVRQGRLGEEAISAPQPPEKKQKLESQGEERIAEAGNDLYKIRFDSPPWKDLMAKMQSKQGLEGT